MASNHINSYGLRVGLYLIFSLLLFACMFAAAIAVLGFVRPGVEMRYLIQLSNGLQKSFYICFGSAILSGVACWFLWRLSEFDTLVVWPKYIVGFFILALLVTFSLMFVSRSGAVELVGDKYFLVGRFGRQILTSDQAEVAIWRHLQFLAAMNGLFVAITNCFVAFATRR